MWGEVDPAEVHAVWAAELAGYDGDDLRVALSELRNVCPEFPPTLWQFSALCRTAMVRRLCRKPQIDGPLVPMPERIREQLRAFVRDHSFGAKRPQ